MRDEKSVLEDRFQEGTDARARGVPRSENPYGLRTAEHKEWDAGWLAIFDLDEEDDPESTRDCSLKSNEDGG